MESCSLSSVSSFGQIFKSTEINWKGKDRQFHCRKNSDVPMECGKCHHRLTRNKVQNLLSYGQYSLFKSWRVAVEGDFMPLSKFEGTNAQKLGSKRQKVSIKDIRTLALTKNWLLICEMSRLYRVRNDEIFPVGICLELRRLVPLKFIKIDVSNATQYVIAIRNQNGDVKEYQFMERMANEQAVHPFVTWQKAIGSISPSHDENTLYLTLQMFDTWTKKHSCK